MQSDNIDAEELAMWAAWVRTLGICGQAAFKIAIMAIEYQRPDHGVWNNNT